MNFSTYNRQQRKLGVSSSDILTTWKQHKKEGTFLKGESCNLSSFQPVYLRSNPGNAFTYLVNGVKFLSVKRVNWNTTYWEVFDKPLSQLNIVCY